MVPRARFSIGCPRSECSSACVRTQRIAEASATWPVPADMSLIMQSNSCHVETQDVAECLLPDFASWAVRRFAQSVLPSAFETLEIHRPCTRRGQDDQDSAMLSCARAGRRLGDSQRDTA